MSPFDFLERDVKLARRRKGDERAEYLSEQIGRVVRVLKYQGNDLAACVEKCLNEIKGRFKLENVPLDNVISSAKAQISEAPLSERDTLTIKIVHDFVDAHVYGEDSTY